MKALPPTHPGEVLLEEYLKPLGISPNAVARAIGVPPRRINEIVKGKRAFTVDTAIRLERYFRWPAEVWLNLQAHHDQQLAKEALKAELAGIRRTGECINEIVKDKFNPFDMLDPERAQAEGRLGDWKKSEIGSRCVVWQNDKFLYACAAGPGRLYEGHLVYLKGSPWVCDVGPRRIESGRVVSPQKEIRGIAIPPLFLGFRETTKGGPKSNPMWKKGEPRGEVLILLALRSGNWLDRALAVSVLRQQLEDEGTLGEGLEIFRRGVPRDEFRAFAGEWMVEVVEKDGPVGLEALASWATLAERAIKARSNLIAADADMVRFLKSVGRSVEVEKGVPTASRVRAEWERTCDPMGKYASQMFERISTRAGFGWLPSGHSISAI